MDCVIPSHSVRPFCAAIACLSRIGKDLYLEFDPVEGLSLRALNEAKSAFCSFSWEPSFFDRCSAPPLVKKRQAQDDEEEDGFSCRVPLRAMAAVVKPRRNVLSLRVYSEVANDQQHYLTFEFQLQKTGLLTVVHRMSVAEDSNRIVATMPKEGGSELVASPRVLLKMLEPLHKKSPEVAFIINDEYKLVTATTFHHGNASTASNALLNASTANLLKTETCISVDELEEFDFRDDRNLEEEEQEGVPKPPKNANQEVALVFVGKEAKALLQFGAQAISNEELRISITFHWGGRPVLMETRGPSFTAQLIVATLDHKLLGGLKRVNPEGLAERERRVSSRESNGGNQYAAVAASS